MTKKEERKTEYKKATIHRNNDAYIYPYNYEAIEHTQRIYDEDTEKYKYETIIINHELETENENEMLKDLIIERKIKL